MSGEAPPFRWGLVGHFWEPSASPAVAAALVRRAVFDSAPEVRAGAVAGLRQQAPETYVPLLLEGLRHPWPPANFHAATALVALDAGGAVPALIRLLDAADARDPVEMDVAGKKVPVTRELVRLNHNGNCLLCHAPSLSERDLVRGPVPDPQSRLPEVYYQDRSMFSVRADITYLRQDFSEVLPVVNPGHWPEKQRFDFLVRVRPLTEDELRVRALQEQLAGPRPLPPTKRAALFALQELTGLDGGLTSSSWMEAVADGS
jgi:hypothetical protein